MIRLTGPAMVAMAMTALAPFAALAQGDEEFRHEVQDALRQDLEHLEASRQHLTVPDATLSDWFLDYHTKIRETLLGDAPSSPYIRMIVLPSFTPEWMIEIERPIGSSAVVRYVLAEGQVWSKGRTLKAQTTTATISLDLVQAVRTIWLQMLNGVRYPDTGALRADGTTYYFAAFDVGRGVLSGEVWSPPEDAPTGRLVRIGELVRDYIVSDDQNRGAVETALQEATLQFTNTVPNGNKGIPEKPPN